MHSTAPQALSLQGHWGCKSSSLRDTPPRVHSLLVLARSQRPLRQSQAECEHTESEAGVWAPPALPGHIINGASVVDPSSHPAYTPSLLPRPHFIPFGLSSHSQP